MPRERNVNGDYQRANILHRDGAQRLLLGSSETLIPVFVTFAFLAVAWLFVAVGTPPGLGIARRIAALRRTGRAELEETKE